MQNGIFTDCLCVLAPHPAPPSPPLTVWFGEREAVKEFSFGSPYSSQVGDSMTKGLE